jgi:preprotein translocase subunit SecA
MVRKDENDLVYLTIGEKYDAIVQDILECIKRDQPVLVGTASIESSERLSTELEKRQILHSVLNAKQHEREAEIVAQAGRPGVVTIATNMAGRGTDIVLGGKWEAEVAQLENPTPEQITEIKREWQKRHDHVVSAGGLHIIGTERHESRRIDNQLRGRSGRQGDPGSSRFYLSMEDNLMRIFASDRVRGIMQSLGLEKGEAIEHRMVNNAIEKAQRKVEAHNFDMRKNVLEFDDVANDQRQVIYQQRNELMEVDDIADMIAGLREEVVAGLITDYIPPQSIEEQWDIAGLEQALLTEFNSKQPIKRWLDEESDLNEEGLRARVIGQIVDEYKAKEAEWTAQGIDMRVVEKQILLNVLDQRWKEHLARMDYLRQGIHLRAYAQKQPKQEYKREAFELFQELLDVIKRDAVRLLSRVQIERKESLEDVERKRREEQAKRMQYSHDEAAALTADGRAADGRPADGRAADGRAGPRARPGAAREGAKVETFVRQQPKVGRNEPCPCGSGKKYKQCHGKTA